MISLLYFLYLVSGYTHWHSHTLQHTQANATFHHIHHPAPIDMDTESRLPCFLWSRSRACGVGLNVGYCYLRVCAGILGVSIAFRHRPSWPGHKSLSLLAASRPISATLIFNTSITWLCSLKVSEERKWQIECKQDYLPSRAAQPAAASTLGRKSAGPGPALCGAVCWRERCQPWFCHRLVGG